MVRFRNFFGREMLYRLDTIFSKFFADIFVDVCFIDCKIKDLMDFARNSVEIHKYEICLNGAI